MTRRAFAVVFLCLLTCSLASLAADKPDFSGNWKLNVDKSDFGPMPKPEKADYVIVHKDPEMNVKQTAVTQMGEMTSDVKILTDGTEFTNTVRGQEVKFSPREYDLLRLLVAHAGKVLTHNMILREVWGPNTDVQYLRIYIRALRQKIERDTEKPEYILTETGVGYRLRAPD